MYMYTMYKTYMYMYIHTVHVLLDSISYLENHCFYSRFLNGVST